MFKCSRVLYWSILINESSKTLLLGYFNLKITFIQGSGYAMHLQEQQLLLQVILTTLIPVGGVVASVGSTGGFGYQPLVAAGGTAIVSTAGTVSSISIGNSGSGYRVGVQTVVNVAIQTGTNTQPQLIGIGTAAITDGHITGIAITNSQVIYAPRAIYDVGYTSTTGITTITTTTAHGLAIGQEIKLAGIAFTCDYLPAVGVQSASYEALQVL